MKKTVLTSLIFLSLLVTPLSVSGQNLPNLGDSSQSVLSSQDEAELGQKFYRQLLAQGAISQDIAFNEYLNQIGSKITQGITEVPGYTFFGINDASVNAFAMPGGYIGVHIGLLLATQSEAELASVLAHEAAHVSQRHLARRQEGQLSNTLLLTAALIAGAVAASQGQGEMATGLASAGLGATIANQLSYSRDFEREADRIGIQYLANSGFDASAMPLFFSRLQNIQRYNDHNAYAFLRTHPITTERIGEGQNFARAYPIRLKADSLDYVLIREHLRVIAMGADEAIRYYSDALAQKKYLNEGSQYYGLARAYFLKNRLPEAQSALIQAEKKVGKLALLIALNAQLAGKNKQYQQEQKIYSQGLARFPSSQLLRYGQIDALLAHEQNTRARQLIQKYLFNERKNPELYQRLAQTYGENDRLYANSALGDRFYYQGLYQAALQQYEEALKDPRDDFYKRSQIEAQIKEVTRLLQAENKEKKKK